MKDVTKEYYILETELCILLALKGGQTLYGICVSSAQSMTREELYHSLFAMQKKGMIRKADDSNTLRIAGGLDSCIERIQTAERFWVLSDSDALVPENYFYAEHDAWRRGAVMLEAAGKYDAALQEGAFRMKIITGAALSELFRENGFLGGQDMAEQEAVPAAVFEEAQSCWQEDKDTILQRATVKKLLQEYDICTQQKIRQSVQFRCGLDTYLVDSDSLERREKVWY
ncbi:MAG: hypothetical protein K2P39_11320 [Lachnospiraceae bacterium]|nr:hypothetical protein [Lachnospiraceae bacterium]